MAAAPAGDGVRPALYIFDCDGVLIDSETLAAQAVAQELAGWGVALAPATLATRFAGFTDAAIAEVLRAETGRAIPADFPARVAQRALALFAGALHAMPGASALLAGLCTPCCVASNSGAERLARSLEIAGLAGFFPAKAQFSAEAVASPKPAPDLHRLAAARMGVRPGDCLVIEDSVTGVRAARAAGMAALGFTGAGHLPPDQAARLGAAGAAAVVDRLDAVPDAVAAL